jgi:hypothetical protein
MGLLRDVRNDALRETQRRQRPWESSGLTERFYFKTGANPVAPPFIPNPVLPAPTPPQTNTSRAEQAQKFCDTEAMERKLAGKAKLAFIKACITTAVGN